MCCEQAVKGVSCWHSWASVHCPALYGPASPDYSPTVFTDRDYTEWGPAHRRTHSAAPSLGQQSCTVGDKVTVSRGSIHGGPSGLAFSGHECTHRCSHTWCLCSVSENTPPFSTAVLWKFTSVARVTVLPAWLHTHATLGAVSILSSILGEKSN